MLEKVWSPGENQDKEFRWKGRPSRWPKFSKIMRMGRAVAKV